MEAGVRPPASLFAGKVVLVECAYWLSRMRASKVMARGATNAEARLIHYELAGRYSIKAAQFEIPNLHLIDAAPVKANGVPTCRTSWLAQGVFIA